MNTSRTEAAPDVDPDAPAVSGSKSRSDPDPAPIGTSGPGDHRQPHRVLRPESRRLRVDLRELWRFRDLLTVLGGRDIRLRYRQTALGATWVVLQPVLAAGIFAFVFGRVARLPSEGVPYFVFAYAGLLGWTAFNATLTKASNSLVSNTALVSKVFFPRMLLPVSVVGSTLVDFGVSFVIMVLLILINGIGFSPAILLLPVFLLALVLAALGAGMVAASLMVSYRDVQYIVPVMTQLLLYATPVAYGMQAVPEPLRPLVLVNPLAGIIEGFRWSLLSTSSPDPAGLAYSVVASLGLFAVGVVTFQRMERRFADVI